MLMKFKYEKEFRKAHPETTGEKDSAFDLCNYTEWLETIVSRVELPVIQPALHYCEYNEPKTVCGVTFAPHKVKTVKSNSVSRRCIIEDSGIEITNMGEELLGSPI